MKDARGPCAVTSTVRKCGLAVVSAALMASLALACHKRGRDDAPQNVARRGAETPTAEGRPEPLRTTPAAAVSLTRPSDDPRPSLPSRPRPIGSVVNPTTGQERALPEPPLGPGDRPAAGVTPVGLSEGPTAQGDTVDVRTLPTGAPPNPAVAFRPRRAKPPVPQQMDPEARAPETQVIDPSAAPPSRLQPAEEGRAPIGPGSPAVSQEVFSAASTDGVPFDVDLAVGTNHIVAAVNTRFRIYDKSGNLLQGETTYRDLFAAGGATPNCGAAEGANSFLADPQVVFDEKSNRWVMALLRVRDYAANTSTLCLACSQTGDPTAVWNKYEFNVPGALLADYPHLAAGEDALFVGVNNFAATSFSGATAWAFNKSQAYSGAAVTSATYSWGPTYFTPQPSELRGFFQGQYPGTTVGHYVAIRDNAGNVDLWRWPKPTLTSTPAVYANDLLPAAGEPPDMGSNGSTITTKTIDGGDSRPMDAELRWPYLWMARSALFGASGSVQWWGGDVSGASPSDIQSGNYAAAGRTLHWPDCTVDKANNFAVGFTGASDSASVFPSAYITGRENGITGDDLLENYGVSQAGLVRYDTPEGTPGSTTECGASRTCPPVRWGDYAGVVVDPSGCDIWFHGQYTASTGAGEAQTKTWLRKFKFPSCSVTNNLTLDSTRYTCSDTLTLWVEDSAALTAAGLAGAVVVTSTTDSEHIPAGGWTDLSEGAGTKWQATLALSAASGSGADDGVLRVADGTALAVTFNDPHVGHPAQTRSPAVDCQITLGDGGFLVYGGCDNSSAGEAYNAYMDAGEYSAYTFGFVNEEGCDLTDATATLSVSGAGASAVTLFNPTVALGFVPAGGLAGGVFNLYVAPSVTDLAPLTLTLSVTSPADGMMAPSTLVHAHLLDGDDTVVTYRSCQTFTGGTLAGYSDQVVTGAAANPWLGITNSKIVGESRTDGGCANSSRGVATTATALGNFAAGADSVLTKAPFQPANTGTAPNGQAYHYIWKAHTFYGSQESAGDNSGAWGLFWNDRWGSATTPTGDQVIQWSENDCCYYHSIMDWGAATGAAWDWESANTGTPDAATGAPPNQFVYRFPYDAFGGGWRGLATSGTYFSWGHEHFDANTTDADNLDIAVDNDQLIYDTFYASGDATPCAAGSQPGRISWDSYVYSTCPGGTATLSVLDDNASAPFTATVTSGAGDSEAVTFTGTAPYFTGTLSLSTTSGLGAGNGTLFMAGADTLTATYADTSPAGTTSATARVAVATAPLTIQGRSVSDNGDHDGYADTNETVTFTLTLANGGTADLHNVSVKIMTASPASVVDCIARDTATFGTLAAGGTAANPVGQEFRFHVNPSYACTNPDAPERVFFTVVVSGDELCAPAKPLSTSFYLDISPLTRGGQPAGPRQTEAGTGIAPSSAAAPPAAGGHVYELPAVERAASPLGARPEGPAATPCGNTYYDDTLLYDAAYFFGGGYAGNTNYMAGVLFDPADFDLAGVGYKISEVCFANDYAYGSDQPTRFYIYADSSGVPVDATPLYAGVKHWGTGTGPSIVSINPAIQMGANAKFWVLQRGDPAFAGSYDLVWESDRNNSGHTYTSTTGIYGLAHPVIPYEAIYHVTLTPSVLCDTTDNSALPGCSTCSAPSALTNSGAADANPLGDTGVQVTWAQDAGNWGDGGSGTRTYDVLRNGSAIQSGIPYGTTAHTDATGVNGTSYTYSVRYHNGCGQSATTAGASAADWVDPGETAAGGLTWTAGSKTQLGWTANPGAVLYNLYRGTRAGLPSLLTSSNDSCTRYTGAANAATNLSETHGSAGDFYWFLVTGVNGGGGEGTAGNATAGPRIVNSTGTCP